MRVVRVVEIELFNDKCETSGAYVIDASELYRSKKYPKKVHQILRECLNTTIMGGAVTMRGTVTFKA